MRWIIIKGFFVYRFLDKNQNIIYIGKTNSLNSRIAIHFNNGHLPNRCYEVVHKIEYIETISISEMNVYEIYLINKHRPFYNRINNNGDSFTFQLPDKEWKLVGKHLYKDTLLQTDSIVYDSLKTELELIKPKYLKATLEIDRVVTRVGWHVKNLEEILNLNPKVDGIDKQLKEQLNLILLEMYYLKNYDVEQKEVYRMWEKNMTTRG